MKSYTKIYILAIVLIVILCFIMTGIELWIEGRGDTLPWAISAIYACCLASATHIVAGVIYEESKDKKSGVEISDNSKALVFLISMVCQLAATFYVCFEAWKRFGNIHPVEYFVAAIFMLLSAYFFKRASYRLINKEKKNEKDKTK